jgi:pimeloyl-ACP methyl ester carboxylesterase
MLRRDFLKTAMATAVLTAALPVQAKKDSRHVERAFCRRQWPAYFLQRAWRRQAAHSSPRWHRPGQLRSNLAELAKSRQVIAPHLQAHGRTPDTDRPLRSETMGDDIAALIGHLKLGNADVMGYSLGSGVALQTAIRHPDVVDRLVLVSAAMKQDGFYPEGVAAFKQLEANAATFGPGVKASPLGKAYPDVDWTNLFRKVGDMTKRPFDWSADVAKLHTRTLLVYADADAIRPEHMVEFWKALGGGQRDAGIDGSLRPANELAILPNTTHYTLPVDPMLPEIVGRFLGAAPKAVG